MKKVSKKLLSISLIGYPTIRQSSSIAKKLPTQKAQAILLYLIAEKIMNGVSFVSKEKLIDLLWPGMPLSSALQNLRQTIYQIRKSFSEREKDSTPATSPLLMTDRKNVWLSDAIKIYSDLGWYYETESDSGRVLDQPVETVIKWYDKPFLENFHVPNTPQYDEWINVCRLKLAKRHIALLEKMLAHLVQTKNYLAATKVVECLINKDPYSEQYNTEYMELLAAQHRRNSAIQAFQSYQKLLEHDLGLRPGPKMNALYHSIQKNQLSHVDFISDKEPTSPIDAIRIAILPMKDYTNKDFLAEGLTDDVLIGLTKVEGIKMISRQSTIQYKDTPKPPSQIGEELNVEYLLRGSITQLEHQYKVNVQFLESATGEVLWAETFTRAATQISSLQIIIIQGITNYLYKRFGWTNKPSILANTTKHSEAYNAYLKGRYSFYKANPTGLREAIIFFQYALDLDPKFDLAHAWLAWTYCTLAGSWGDQSALEMYPKVQQELAYIENNQELESMYFKILGWMHFWLLDRSTSENYFRKAVKANPNEEFGLSALAMILTLRKNFEEGKQIAIQALDINPHFFWNHFVLGQAFYYDGQFEEAALAIEKGLNLFENHQASIGIRSKLMALNGQYDQAIAYLQEAISRFPEPPSTILSDLGLVYAVSGAVLKATAIANELLKRHKKKEEVYGLFAAKIFSELGQHEQAIQLLEDAFEDKDNELNWLEVELEFKPLYPSSRFQRLLHRLVKQPL